MPSFDGVPVSLLRKILKIVEQASQRVRFLWKVAPEWARKMPAPLHLSLRIRLRLSRGDEPSPLRFNVSLLRHEPIELLCVCRQIGDLITRTRTIGGDGHGPGDIRPIRRGEIRGFLEDKVAAVGGIPG